MLKKKFKIMKNREKSWNNWKYDKILRKFITKQKKTLEMSSEINKNQKTFVTIDKNNKN